MVELSSSSGSGGGGGSGTPADVTDGTTTVSDADPISVSGTNLSTVTVSEPTTGEAAVDVDTVIPTDHIGVDEIDQSISPSWTGSHDFVQPAPSSGFNVFTRYTEDGSTKQVRWGINSNGEIALRYTTGGGSPGTLMSFGSAFTGVEFFEQIIAGTGIRETSFQDYGASNEFREEYNSNQDSLDISDQPNSAVRARMDRSTGDLTIEGTLTEGATL